MILLAAILVLQPVADDPGTMRLASMGTDGHDVDWSLDGTLVATTSDGRAATIDMPAGIHTLTAQTHHGGAWAIMARPEPAGAGIAYVPAWSARTDGQPAPAADLGPPAFPMAGAVLLGLGALAGGRSLRARVRRRSRRRRDRAAAADPSTGAAGAAGDADEAGGSPADAGVREAIATPIDGAPATQGAFPPTPPSNGQDPPVDSEPTAPQAAGACPPDPAALDPSLAAPPAGFEPATLRLTV